MALRYSDGPGGSTPPDGDGRILRRASRGGADPGDRGAREAVGAVVEHVAGVTRDLVPGDLVALGEGHEGLPEVAVLDRLLLRVLPAVLAPALVPLVPEAIDEVRAVAVKIHAPATLERAQALDGGAQLHALVGGPFLAARQLPLVAAVDHDGGPASGAGIARAGA